MPETVYFFLFLCSIMFSGHTKTIYQFSCWTTYGLFPVAGNFEQIFYKLWYAGFCLNILIELAWVNIQKLDSKLKW